MCVPYWSILWNGSTLHFYPRSPGLLKPTYLSFIPAIYGCTPLIPGVLGFFFFFWLSFQGTTSPFSSSWFGLIFFKFGMACRPRSVRGWGGRGGRTTRGCVLGASFELPPLFLLVNRPFKLGLFSKSIASSSSSDFGFIRAMTNYSGWMEERLADSVSESEISTGFSNAPSSSMKRNWFISSSRDSREDAISSSAMTVASRGTCCNGITSGGGIWWMGSLTGGRSSQAKKSGLDTSIWFIRGSPALMAWPISWKVFEIGSIQNQMNGSQLLILAHEDLWSKQVV